MGCAPADPGAPRAARRPGPARPPWRRSLALLAMAALVAAPGAGRGAGPDRPGVPDPGRPSSAADLGLPVTASDELSFGSASQAVNGPRTNQVTDWLALSLGLAPGWRFDVDAITTSVGATTPLVGRDLGARGGVVTAFDGGPVWHPDGAWTAGLLAGLSPTSTLRLDTPVDRRTKAGTLDPVNALVESDTSDETLELLGGYDTPADRPLALGLDLDAKGTRYAGQQSLVAIQGSTGLETAAQLGRYCDRHACSAQLRALLRQPPAELGQLELHAAATVILLQDTDLTLGGSWFLYDRDPVRSGFFDLLAVGRLRPDGAAPIAPYLWTLRPEVTRALGPVTALAWWEHGEFVPTQGWSNAVGGRLSAELGDSLRLWIAGLVEADRDQARDLLRYAEGEIGLRWLVE